MKLVWKLLRQHISIPQFMGFFFANLFGVFIIILGYQFYRDVKPVFTSEDSFMKADYLIVSKRIGGVADSNAFSPADVSEIEAQPFVRRVGQFLRAEYQLQATMGVGGKSLVNTELFFESVPDAFVDAPLAAWKYEEGAREVPIILPRTYINMYNFGFAQSHGLPKIGEGLTGMIDFRVFVHGNGLRDEFTGKVVGFSSRLNTILVPQSFMEWSNNRYAPNEHSRPSRLIMEVASPADERIAQFMDKKGYEVEDDKLQAEKMTYFLKVVVALVMIIGLVIAALSFYILMLSIYLLLQKNAEKLENLLLLGYSPARVARPYQLLTVGLNLLVLLIALLAVWRVREYYLDMLDLVSPMTSVGTMLPALLLGILLLVVVSVFNLLAIHRKVAGIWKRRD